MTDLEEHNIDRLTRAVLDALDRLELAEPEKSEAIERAQSAILERTSAYIANDLELADRCNAKFWSAINEIGGLDLTSIDGSAA